MTASDAFSIVPVLLALFALCLTLGAAPLHAMGRKAVGRKKGGPRKPKPAAPGGGPKSTGVPGGGGRLPVVPLNFPKWSFPRLGPVLGWTLGEAERHSAAGRPVDSRLNWSRLGALVRGIYGRHDPRGWAALSRESRIELVLGRHALAFEGADRAADGLGETAWHASGPPDSASGVGLGEETLFAVETREKARTVLKGAVPETDVPAAWDFGRWAAVVPSPAAHGVRDGMPDAAGTMPPGWDYADASGDGGRAGRLESLRAELEGTLARHGDVAPETLDVMCRLASQLACERGSQMGFVAPRLPEADLAEARKICRSVAEDRRRDSFAGMSPERRAEFRMLEAELAGRAGEAEEALRLASDALEAAVGELGPSHELSFAAMAGRADWLGPGRDDEAAALYLEASRGLAVLGKASLARFAGVMVSLAELRLRTGDLPSAVETRVAAWEFLDMEFGRLHGGAVSLRAATGLLLRRLGEYGGAARLLARAASEYAGILGASHPLSVDLANMSAFSRLLDDDMEGALVTLKDASEAGKAMPQGPAADHVRAATLEIAGIVHSGISAELSQGPPDSPFPEPKAPGKLDPVSSYFFERPSPSAASGAGPGRLGRKARDGKPEKSGQDPRSGRRG
ncbi:MAG: hypothetical protein LBT40_00865 [Deltaproteobacteria bacterium]|jgi:hypothetical protein|nr:hypothetical protein [Deltaproteobacteria bacterium]